MDKGLQRAPVQAAMSKSKATGLQTQHSHSDPDPSFSNRRSFFSRKEEGRED